MYLYNSIIKFAVSFPILMIFSTEFVFYRCYTMNEHLFLIFHYNPNIFFPDPIPIPILSPGAGRTGSNLYHVVYM